MVQLQLAGEWIGVSSTYKPDGTVIPLPELYVPESYKEWGIEANEWQTQCSVQVDKGGMEYNLRRLYTGTGCEADSIAKTETIRALECAEYR